MHLIVEVRGTFVSKHQGRLRFEKQQQRLAEVQWSLSQLRPLRIQAEIDADTRDDQDEG